MRGQGLILGTGQAHQQNQELVLLHLRPVPILLHGYARCYPAPPPLRDARRRVVRAIVSALALAHVSSGRQKEDCTTPTRAQRITWACIGGTLRWREGGRRGAQMYGLAYVFFTL